MPDNTETLSPETRLGMIENNLTVIDNYITNAHKTMELVANHEDSGAIVSGPLDIAMKALEEAQEDIEAMSADVGKLRHDLGTLEHGGFYGEVQSRLARLEATPPDVSRAYRLACDLHEHLDEIRDVRHSLVGLSMASLEDWMDGSIALAFREIDRILGAIDDLTEPVAEAYRQANGIKHEEPEAAQ